ncbi:hypothetical protein [Marinifilum caeruleilacunae]|uniref:Uncharacterized protein n=1 Tax=Marinifilum caeruleilacunae TaxID=2499076 RepID=A0ABX1WU29_9BACT|nr:hypothetical protein [Marinifilum caeruleilacunae]NOU59598.1 hypothetical protein [Marinifilum caeruleilacunae]
MKKTNHCELCDLQAFDFKSGIICGLTKQKPSFQKQCSNISLEQKLAEKLVEINLECEDLKHVKRQSILNLVFYLIIGIAVIYLSYFIGTILPEAIIFHTITIIIFVAGLVLLGKGIGGINFYNQRYKVLSPKKEVLDQLTRIYNIDYEFKSQITTDLMDVKRTNFELFIGGKSFVTKHVID